MMMPERSRTKTAGPINDFPDVVPIAANGSSSAVASNVGANFIVPATAKERQQPSNETSSFPSGTAEVRELRQMFEGVVVEIQPQSFTASLFDLTARDSRRYVYTDIVNTFDFEEVPRRERELIRPGARFNWVIERVTRAHGQEELSLRIQFKRTSKSQASISRKNAGEIVRGFIEASVYDESD
ncbi:hypothetical protein [Ancylobacter terrae]|uniref:hypothetical protein n=1 Tax=Ancylobacter sp. sgz301288 TaxID=3342077 RepID=UPI00385CAB51